MYASYSKFSKELKNGIEILVGQEVKDETSQYIVLCNNSKTAWSS